MGHVLGDVFPSLIYQYSEYFFVIYGTNSTYGVLLDILILHSLLWNTLFLQSMWMNSGTWFIVYRALYVRMLYTGLCTSICCIQGSVRPFVVDRALYVRMLYTGLCTSVCCIQGSVRPFVVYRALYVRLLYTGLCTSVCSKVTLRKGKICWFPKTAEMCSRWQLNVQRSKSCDYADELSIGPEASSSKTAKSSSCMMIMKKCFLSVKSKFPFMNPDCCICITQLLTRLLFQMFCSVI